MVIYISTACLHGENDLAQVLKVYTDNGICRIELGSCHRYEKGLIDLVSFYSGVEFIVHNFFPPAEEPFILNLAAQNQRWREKSVAACKEALDICYKFGYPLYSFHPGFRVEDTLELGFKLSSPIVPYEAAFKAFCRSVEEICSYSKRLRIKVAVENLEQKNEAYMMSNPEEFQRLLEIFPDMGVLLDLGHLKIASRKLGFEIREFISCVQDNIAAVHIHENDGIRDLHLQPLGGEVIQYLEDMKFEVLVLEAHNLDVEKIRSNYNALDQFART